MKHEDEFEGHLKEWRELQGLWRDPKLLDEMLISYRRGVIRRRVFYLLFLILYTGLIFMDRLRKMDPVYWVLLPPLVLFLVPYVFSSTKDSNWRMLMLMKLMQHEVGVKKTVIPDKEEF